MTKKKKPLSGLSVLVTRPEEQAEALCALIEQAGGKATKLPLQKIVPPEDVQPVVKKLSAAAKYDWAIFCSINSVKQALALHAADAGWPANLACVGASTARTLEECGLTADAVPSSGSSSEDLLELDVFEDVHEKRILIVKGKGGRDLMAKTLSARGAQVDELAVYRRAPVELQSADVEALAQEHDVIVITSGEALERLADATESSKATVFRTQLLVPSQRVANIAEELGFISRPLMPEQISDQGILDALVASRSRSG